MDASDSVAKYFSQLSHDGLSLNVLIKKGKRNNPYTFLVLSQLHIYLFFYEQPILAGLGFRNDVFFVTSAKAITV